MIEPWHKTATPRKEVREGRSFNPDEFAIHLEQVIGNTAPDDYIDSAAFALENKSYIAIDPDFEWDETGSIRRQIAEWTRQRGKSPRLYPGALAWCLKKPGKDLREKVELWLAWRKVDREIAEGTLGGEFDLAERAEMHSRVTEAAEAAKDEVWAGYRFAVVSDSQESDGLKAIDLGAGHSSISQTLCGRVISALRARAKTTSHF